MAPVVDGLASYVVPPIDDSVVLAYHLAFSRYDQSVGVHPQADRPIRERCGDAVARPVEGNQAGRGYTFGVLHEAVKRRRRRHQEGFFLSPDISDSARQLAVGNLLPQCLAPDLEPIVELGQCRERRNGLPEAMAGITHILFDLPLLPA
ncbi:hypothetical protein D3C87_1681620 [compost metagenome]